MYDMMYILCKMMYLCEIPLIPFLDFFCGSAREYRATGT